MYYQMETNYFAKPEPYRTRAIAPTFGFAPSYWIRGRTLKAPSAPIKVELWERGGDGLAELFLDSIPVFRNDLVELLIEAGVDNLQTFPAVLVDPKGKQIEDFKAVNIVGLVKCADLTKSQYDDITGTGMMAMGFRKLVIDEAAAAGHTFFRLAEAVASIIVHEHVKARIDEANFRYLSWRSLA
jgi:hypothetical protein